MAKKSESFGKCLKGKIAVVTGAARGIGRAAAVAFAREGADVIGIDICKTVCIRSGVKPSTPKDLEETGKFVKAEKVRWKGVELDQRDFSALKKSAAEIAKEFKGIDIVFANAGIQEFRPLLEMDDVEWQTHLDVNLTGTLSCH